MNQLMFIFYFIYLLFYYKGKQIISYNKFEWFIIINLRQNYILNLLQEQIDLFTKNKRIIKTTYKFTSKKR